MTGVEGWECTKLEELVQIGKWLYYATKVLKWLGEQVKKAPKPPP
ncbi:MAG TPA: hypothetical protein VF077_13485 [Nitrospiraceae bacterium]